ncbi:hypothetical protein [Botrimarina mediterranea]|uniref:Uncharacterized protein n=1 Tax=Botrimarina mediterranea TaxID=2528022 RepID=A0A518K3J2_9BACT|nr:hypothetical protein [Botrimarina mediterranea]QDV72364.1 hypothetical protein Spa11_05380 [Botrimarina mediterranea]QDV76910.1 hypothetical protein K2D_04930 [Planctomycetes bacterium K2D]
MSVTDIAAFGASTLASAAGAASNQIERQVQSAFSAVLEAAGRQGYASAAPIADGAPVADAAQQAWDDWFGTRPERYASQASPEKLQQGFGAIIGKAINEEGYADPKGFLAKLNREELATLQSVHSLADPIHVESLTEEGALNLLLPPPAQVDIDADGITHSGAGRGIRFPNSNTPPEVVDAWDSATAGMSWGERSQFELKMMLPTLLANIEVDANGQFIGQREPGDPDYRNPMAELGYSYRDTVQSMIDALDFQKEQMPRDQYEEQRAFWRRFGEELEATGAE